MKMNDLLNGDPDKNPFKRAETEIVNVEITSIPAINNINANQSFPMSCFF